ncbi:MAG TPA: FAD-binding protein [Casimicrobiaceae bacterium]|nr:FAD-binding protein [Casimicrobiaceae bacterium]
MAILVLAEHDHDALRASTLPTITAARELGDVVHVLVAGSNASGAAKAAAAVHGVTGVIHVDAPHFAKPVAEDVAAQVMAVIDALKPTHVLAPATGFGKNILPRVAAKLDVAQISDITEVVAPDTFVRPIYAGSVFATVRSADPIKIVTVRTTAFEPAASEGGQATVESRSAEAHAGKATVTGQEMTRSERPELASARVVVSGGRAMQNAENFKLLEALADKLGAAVGASRAAVDAGYVPNDYQVGQTGKIVAPELYIAVGISGAIQHLAGMKDAKVIVAINKDEEAPIFQVADYGLVADLFQALPELEAELTKAGL